MTQDELPVEVHRCADGLSFRWYGGRYIEVVRNGTPSDVIDVDDTALVAKAAISTHMTINVYDYGHAMAAKAAFRRQLIQDDSDLSFDIKEQS